jgi:hypothetical protein
LLRRETGHAVNLAQVLIEGLKVIEVARKVKTWDQRVNPARDPVNLG